MSIQQNDLLLPGTYEDEPFYPINNFIYSIENGLVWTF